MKGRGDFTQVTEGSECFCGLKSPRDHNIVFLISSTRILGSFVDYMQAEFLREKRAEMSHYTSFKG